MTWQWLWGLIDEPTCEPLNELGGFSVGQVVRHKVDARVMVIVALKRLDPNCDMPHGDIAHVTVGTCVQDEFDTYLAEIDPVALAARENAKLGGWPKGKKRGPRKKA